MLLLHGWLGRLRILDLAATKGLPLGRRYLDSNHRANFSNQIFRPLSQQKKKSKAIPHPTTFASEIRHF